MNKESTIEMNTIYFLTKRKIKGIVLGGYRLNEKNF